MTAVKICGITRTEDVQAVNQLLPEYVGFVFAPSSRRIEPEDAARLRQKLAPSIRAVGVFVDMPVMAINRIVQWIGLDIVQLHGKECADVIELINRPVWRSVSVNSAEEAEALDIVKTDGGKGANLKGLLFDTRVAGARGGTGKSFRWDKELPAFKGLRIAAGGLDPENVGSCVVALSPDVVDVSSGVETDGVKDPDKIRRFIETVRRGM